MRAPVSVILPTLNAAPTLPATLGALGEGLSAGLIREVILSDGGSGDATGTIAEQAGATFIKGPAGRGGQIARGVAAAGGDWFLVLHADSLLQPGWSRAVLDHLGTAPDCAGHFRLSFDADGAAPRLVAGWANLRARALGLPFGDQGLLLPRALLDRVGGYPEIPLMEDVSIARALRGHLRPLEAMIVTSAARYREEGWMRRGGRNLALQARYLAGADPARLARAYRAPKSR
ncbi:glycosyl transferase [Brevirhabdus pacifica]|uniref:Glycosyl transferase n=2 Tax=Brevirhabdus pacifica TaxID=1267768 RepID=A0A1U7DH70_9RHOB|nr:TIGR04283 family arsenosugar biosynthesis glycosyltransferase [Brevirhabdus pacifica]APX89332.1 glycosyl transferase [Brevirhabdus pacifica]OWU76642.1 glycosyl transferase [Loktanella sp. 22II-4b]PJJ86044.1 hypothetical protein CLV77_0577 [Brevirhabdus pacifica]